MEGVWKRYHDLVSLSKQAQVAIEEAEWLEYARSFGTAFMHCFHLEDITSYIHVFMYHLGYFLKKYNGIEKFANFVDESKHRENKTNLFHGTSVFRYGESGAAYQQLCASVCNESHGLFGRLNQSTRKRKRAKDTWRTRTISITPQYERHVISSDIIN